MASTPTKTPSSLQEQCLQYLIDHFEDIPVEFLALLPTAIRRTLAVHLPVADILQLEQTRFASGLDMPGVWKKVCEIRHLISRYPKLVEIFESEIEAKAKEFVMMVVTYEALHHQLEKPHSLSVPPIFQAKRACRLQDIVFSAKLPSTPGPLHVPDPPVFFSRVCIQKPFKQPHRTVLSRFVTMQQKNLNSGVLKLLSAKYHFCPERLCIDCSSSVGLKEVLPRLKQLSISCMEYGRIPSQSFLLYSLLSGCSQCLHTLTLDDCPDETIEKIVSTVVSVFTDKPVNIQSLRHFCVTVLPASENKRCGKHRMAFMAEFRCSIKKALTTLCKTIQTHTSLHSCSLRRFPVIDYRVILDSILSLFKQPQFQCLTLAESSLSLKNLERIVHTFLTTACNGPQLLKLECIQVHGTDHNIVSSIHDSIFLVYKSLVLDCSIIPHSSSYRTRVQSSLKKWLCAISKLQLHSLTITNDYSQ